MFVRPEQIIEILNLEPGMTVADFGCGSGHYVIPSAKKVGKSGKVYAIDIQQEMLSFVRSQAQLEGFTNVETIWTDLETAEASRLKGDSTDIVIVSNILFQAEDKNAVIKEAFRILKKGGRAVVVEWDIEKGAEKLGPPMDSRVSPDAAKSLLEKSGFNLEKEFNPGEHHYGLIFRKP